MWRSISAFAADRVGEVGVTDAQLGQMVSWSSTGEPILRATTMSSLPPTAATSAATGTPLRGSASTSGRSSFVEVAADHLRELVAGVLAVDESGG